MYGTLIFPWDSSQEGLRRDVGGCINGHFNSWVGDYFFNFWIFGTLANERKKRGKEHRGDVVGKGKILFPFLGLLGAFPLAF